MRGNKHKEMLRSQLSAHIASVTEGYASATHKSPESAEDDVRRVLVGIVSMMQEKTHTRAFWRIKRKSEVAK